MLCYTENTFDDIYHTLIQGVLAMGMHEKPRGESCIEMRPCVFQLRKPERGIYTGRSRRLNYRFWAIECLSYIAGWGDQRAHAELMIAANSQYRRYYDAQTQRLQPAVCYGLALRGSLPRIYDLLQKDPYSRQAVASIWSPTTSYGYGESPCTLALHFYKNLLCLDMSAIMRSNDLDWGTPYDVASFCAIQVTMAGCLGWGQGTYTHHAGSLHVYEDHIPQIKRPCEELFYASCGDFSVDEIPFPVPMDIRIIMEDAHIFLDHLHYHVCVEEERWADFKVPTELAPRAYLWAHWLQFIKFSWARSDREWLQEQQQGEERERARLL